MERLEPELAKCQVLCYECHQVKTAQEASERWQGAGHPKAKLTEDDVLAIRAATGTSAEIAVLYGTSPRNIRFIRSRKSWTHI